MNELDQTNLIGEVYARPGSNPELVQRVFLNLEKLMEKHEINFLRLIFKDEPETSTYTDTRTGRKFTVNSKVNGLISTKYGGATEEIYNDINEFHEKNPFMAYAILAWDRCRFDPTWKGGSRVANGEPIN